MNQNTVAGKLPGWTLLVSLLGWLVAPMILWTCRDFGLSWWIGVPAALAVVIVGALLDRAIERKYLCLFRISSGWTAGSSAGASPAKRTLDARGVNKLVQGWLRQNAAISPARASEL